MARRSPNLGRTAGFMVVALAAVSLVVGAPAALRDQQTAAYPAAAATSGSLQMTNSLDGSAILSAEGLGPGGSTSGTVTITNSGDIEGAFSLAKSNIAGELAQQLDLTVTDTTAGVGVYSGKLAAMGERPLGTFAAGEGRTYRFEAGLPNSGNDNAYQGARATFQFDWTATSDGVGSSADRTAPQLGLRVAKRQRARRALVLQVRCDEACRLGVSGKLAIKKVRRKAKLGSKRLTPSSPAGRWKTLKVKLPRKVLAAAKKSLAARRRVTATLRLTAQDAAGNVGVRTFKIRLKK